MKFLGLILLELILNNICFAAPPLNLKYSPIKCEELLGVGGILKGQFDHTLGADNSEVVFRYTPEGRDKPAVFLRTSKPSTPTKSLIPISRAKIGVMMRYLNF
jgi:hypothetical protein